MKRVLFVCTGNTCRSPMAEAVLRHYGGEAFEVKSAGVYAAVGSDASEHAKKALQAKGIAINHISQQVTEDLLQWADVVLTMTNSHKQMIARTHPVVQKKVYTLYEYINKSNRDISDPYGGSLQTYEATLQELEELLQNLVKNHTNADS